MKTFPTLYKRTNTGAIEQWTIQVYSVDLGGNGVIRTEYGHVGGKMQETSDTVSTGKNLGKKNATTAYQQAELEAEAKWTKQLKKGYVESVEAAEAGEVDAVIEGGIAPMLAPSKIYPTFAKHLQFPVFVQPKLDGQRCIAVVDDGRCTLWTRTRKPIRSVPHIAAEIEVAAKEHFPAGRHVFDGELYADAFSADFEELMSICRKDEPDTGGKYLSVEYHLYDCPTDPGEVFSDRYQRLAWVDDVARSLKRVKTLVCHDHDAIMSANEDFVEMGYEGSMVRNDGPYEGGRRSFHLQKLKAMVDQEFEVIGAEEGRGKDAGTVGAFVCRTKDGKTFRCRLKASYARRRELFENPSLWKNSMMTVKYQNLSSDGIPRFPIGKGLRPPGT